MRLRTATTILTVLCAATVSTGCSEPRERPAAGPTGPAGPGPMALEVVVQKPQTNNAVWYAGNPATIIISANDSSGQLVGIGYVVRRHAPVAPTLDSAAVAFAPTADTVIHSFELTIPDTMPHNSQLEVIGLAFGPDTLSARSEPEFVVVAECPDNAIYC